MTASSDRQILLAAASGDLVAAVRGAMQSAPHLKLEVTRPDSGEMWTKATAAAAVVVEVNARSAGAVMLVRRLAATVRAGRVIVAARNAGAEEVRGLFRAGAADVITWPLAAEQIRIGVSEALRDEFSTAVERGAVISVLKGCGGAGATTVALNLAALLAKGDEKRRSPPMSTAVLDLDLQFGDSDVALDLTPRSTVLDVMRAGDRLDPRFLDGVMCEHESGIKLLAPPPSLVPLDALTPELAAELVEHASRGVRRTVIDLPGAWTDWTLPVLARSDLIVLVTPPTVAGAVGARRVLEALRGEGLNTELMFVLNRARGMFQALDRSGRIGRELDLKVEVVLRDDPLAARAADAGRLAVAANPGAPLAKDLRACAGRLEARLQAQRATPSLAELAA